MGRLITTAALLAALLASPVLSGCSGDGGASTPTPSPTPTSTSPTASPTPQPPAMPEAARAHTPEGAEAFVRHFWAVVDYAGTTLDAAPLKSLIRDDCLGCQGVIDLITELREGGGTLVGSHSRLSNIQAIDVVIGGKPRTQVTFTVSTPKQVLDYPGTDRDQTFPAGKRTDLFLLEAISGGWQVVSWDAP